MIYLIVFCSIVAIIAQQVSYKKIKVIANIMVALSLSLIIAFAGGKIAKKVMPSFFSEPITITATGDKNPASEGSEVWIKDIIVDGKSYSPKKFFKGTWIIKNNEVGWKDYDQPDGLENNIGGKIPLGKDRKIIFESDKYRGIVSVDFSGDKRVVDLYSKEEQKNGLNFDLSESDSLVINDANKYNKTITMIMGVSSFIFIMILFYFDKKKENIENTEFNIEKREVWIDVLKIISAFAIILIHLSGSIYGDFLDNINQWYNALYLNSITRFAVPCFWMVSGIFIIDKRDSVMEVFSKRLPKIIIPLVFWSICYIVVDKITWGKDSNVIMEILTIPFEHKAGHLWYIYQLVGLYLLTPIINLVYEKTSKGIKIYFITITLIIPGFFDMILKLCNYSKIEVLSINWNKVGFAEIALVFLGKLLIDEMKNKQIRRLWCYIGMMLGFSATVVCSYCISVKNNKPYFNMFDQIHLPVVILGISVFMLFYSYRTKFNNLTSKVKVDILKLSKLTMGVYFMHMLPANFVRNIMNTQVIIKSNILIVILEAVMCYIISIVYCYLISKVPYIKKLVV